MKSQEDTLIEVWNRLEGMWHHHQDGSDFFPVTKEHLDKPYSQEMNDKRCRAGNESIYFDILFNEIQHKIRGVIPTGRQKELS
jgi:hypothetical protein